MENEDDKLKEIYFNTLSDKEKHAYEIAKDHLGCSFSFVKSNGYVKWKKQYLEEKDKK